MRFLTGLALALIPAILAAPVPAPASGTCVDAKITRKGRNLTSKPDGMAVLAAQKRDDEPPPTGGDDVLLPPPPGPIGPDLPPPPPTHW